MTSGVWFLGSTYWTVEIKALQISNGGHAHSAPSPCPRKPSLLHRCLKRQPKTEAWVALWNHS
ncbi:hypothetical protein SCA6_018305 [Theobroma cacao]